MKKETIESAGLRTREVQPRLLTVSYRDDSGLIQTRECHTVDFENDRAYGMIKNQIDFTIPFSKIVSIQAR